MVGILSYNSIFASFSWHSSWTAPTCAFLSVLVFTALLIKIASAKGWVAAPRQDRWNKRAVVRFGGVPILLAFAFGTLFLPYSRETLSLFGLTLLMGVLGFFDDIFRLNPRIKLLAQVLIAIFAVNAGVLQPLTKIFWIDVVFTLFWIVGITNSLNLLDNMDGLAAGIAIIASVQIILLAGPSLLVSGLTICLTAAIAGFLFFNFNPARVFMGDTGAYSIGFFLACASVKTSAHLSSLGSVLFVPCLVLFVPVFDTLLVSVTRRMNGRAISRGARDHASHRLVLMGMSERGAVALLYLFAAVGGVMAFLWKSSWADLGAGIVALFLIAASLFWFYLANLQLPASWLSQGEVGTIAVPELLRQLVKKMGAILLDVVLITLGLYLAYCVRFARLDEIVLGRFLFALALCILFKLSLLIALGGYQQGWSVTRRRHLFPTVEAGIVAWLLLFGISSILPVTKKIEPGILLTDFIVTSVLLILARASTSIFDHVLSGPRVALPAASAARLPRTEITTGTREAAARRTASQNVKLVRIIGRLNVGGPARLACMLQEKLAQDYETHLITGSLAEGEQDMSYLLASEHNVLRLPQMSREISLWQDIVAFWKILRFLRRECPDIVHTHTAKAGALGRLAAWWAGVPVIVHTYEGHIFYGYFGPLQSRAVLMAERVFGKLTNRIIAISDSQLRELCTKYRVAPREKFSVIKNGVALEHFSPSRRNLSRDELGIPHDAFVVVWAGRMVPVKDVQLLAQIVRLAHESGNPMLFVVVGDGTERPQLEALLQGCNNVRLLGWRLDIENVWSAADVALLTSRNEGTPTSLIEAMATGIPFVATHIPGVEDLSVRPLQEIPGGLGQQAANGFLAPPAPEAFLHALALVQKDRIMAARMGAAGRSFALAQFSVPRMLQEMRALYANLLASRSKVVAEAATRASQARDAV